MMTLRNGLNATLYPLVLLLLAAQPLSAHERWVKHDVLAPIDSSIFRSLSFTTLELAARPLLIFIVLAVLWIYREKLSSFLKQKLGNAWARSIDFVFNTEREELLSPQQRRLVFKLATRIPALVLMYAAANASLMMPSFPLEGQLNTIFRFIQTALAVMILAEIAMPFVGLAIAATVLFCFFHFGFNVSIDILPVLGLSYIYMLMPLRSSSRSLQISPSQTAVLQAIVGIAFFLLGVMKLVNFELTIGVADNYPFVMHDPLIGLFSWGSDPLRAREWWTFGFACSELLTGLLLASGIFKRPLALFSAAVFAKLMLMDFGWAEIPHLFPIAVLVLIGTSTALRKDGLKDDGEGKEAAFEVEVIPTGPEARALRQ